jgi:glycosidase
MDFIPNHVARGYYAAAKPASVVGFGEQDDTGVAFSPKNDFYYIPHTSFVVPQGVDAGGADFHSSLKDGKFYEQPAKATGNNVFKPNPSIDDWYETIKLNYGVDVQNGGKEYFDPIPPVWTKMRDILQYWAKKGVDGFRCDAAEMVPAEFWHWVIPQIKQTNPHLIFISEAYNPTEYQRYLDYGHFDYLYNKVGLYDVLKKLIKNETDANANEIDSVMQAQQAFSSHMLDFLENHDEERIASQAYADNAWLAKPAMAVIATVSDAPAMIYFGQELGEKAANAEGFGTDDGRTTIFDYWSVPTVRRWVNGGKFDEQKLSDNEKKLRDFYQKLFHIARQNSAISHGAYREIRDADFTKKQFAYLRSDKNETILVIANFDRDKNFSTVLSLQNTLNKKYTQATDLLTQQKFDISNNLRVSVNKSDVVILALVTKK